MQTPLKLYEHSVLLSAAGGIVLKHETTGKVLLLQEKNCVAAEAVACIGKEAQTLHQN